MPACTGSQLKGPCSRIDLMKKLANIDVQAMYPVGAEPQDKDWTVDTFLKAAEACHKGGYPFGIGVGQTADSVDTAGAFLQAFGGQVVDAKGNVTVKSRRRARMAGVLQEAHRLPAAGCTGLGRRLEQQVADRRQGRHDHEPAECLGGRHARRT